LARRTTPFTTLQTRAFSQSVTRRFTDENGNFDPRSIDRESDEVDVCIVGGGMCRAGILTLGPRFD
jgi:electron-transferring-flavoprotein dehydrogenase